MKKSINLFFVLLIILGTNGCKLSDLRSTNPVISDQIKAKQLMTDMGVAHGIHKWDSIDSYTATFGDEFYGFFGNAGNPFKEEKMKLSLCYLSGSFTGQLEIISGKEKGEIWGIQSWETYTMDENDKAVLKKNKDMEFWIPTYQYFIEFPKKIQEATVMDYVGTKVIEGTQAEGVIVSWNTLEPQKDVDQYVIWIASDTKRIVKIEYTIRAIYGFISGEAFFKDYKYFDGMLLPTEFPIVSSLTKEGLLHQMSIIDFNANTIDPKLLKPFE